MENSCFLGTQGLRELALYSHLIPALAALVLGIFAFVRSEEREKAGYFFLFTITFALWLIADMINWTTNSYILVAATWAPLDYLELLFFALLTIFAVYDMVSKTWALRLAWFLGALLLIPFGLTITGQSVFEFNQPWCEMHGNEFLAQYKVLFEGLMLCIVFLSGAQRVISALREGAERTRSAIVAGSIVLFLGIFAGAEYYSTMTDIYEATLYTLFTLPLFILFLTIAITSYGTFHLGDASVKALFYIFLILASTQFFFVQSMTDFLLACMSFIVIGTMGAMLYRSNEREIGSRHQIEKLSDDKSEFMAFASHEIRNPITAMRGYASLIVDGTVGETTLEVRKAAEQILLTGDEVLRLIAQFLDRSKLELGKITYAIEPFDASLAMEQIAEGFKSHMHERNIEQKCSIPPGIMARGDLGKFKEVLGNIVDNSLKYTREGSITLSVTATENVVRATVSDTGVGIPAETLPHLFQKFSRADAQKANLLGTGLGLYLGKVFVEGMGGKVWAESEGKGKGAQFIIELPRA